MAASLSIDDRHERLFTGRERERDTSLIVYLKEGSSSNSRQLSKQHDFNFSDSDNERGEGGGDQFIKTTLSIVSYWVDNDLT